MTPKIIGIQSDEIDQYWSLMEKWISEACEYSQGRYDPISIRQALKDRAMQCWLGARYVCITQIVEYPLKNVCFVMFFGGEDLDWFRADLALIEDWARVSGCDSVEVVGRPGWVKLLPEYSYKMVLLTKELKP